MNTEQALQIIEQALNQATLKGAFNLNEVSQILQALSVLNSTDKK